MLQGTIKKLTDKGFGFIKTDGDDMFFHMSACEGCNFDDLQEGQAVQYEVDNENKRGKGPRASRVLLAAG